MLSRSKHDKEPARVGAWEFTGAGGVDRTIAQLNIEHFRRLLIEENDAAKRRILHELLMEEEAKLASLDKPALPRDKKD